MKRKIKYIVLGIIIGIILCSFYSYVIAENGLSASVIRIDNDGTFEAETIQDVIDELAEIMEDNSSCFIREEKCTIADGTVINDSTTGDPYSLNIPCSGTYKIEISGASGGNGQGYIVGTNRGGGGYGQAGTAFSTTVTLKFHDLLAYQIGTRGGNGQSSNAGAAGSPGGAIGGTGYYDKSGGMLYSGGGGGGGGYTLLYINNDPKLSANGGNGCSGGGYSMAGGAGGAGGSYPLDMSEYTLTSETGSSGDGYVKITLIQAKKR